MNICNNRAYRLFLILNLKIVAEKKVIQYISNYYYYYYYKETCRETSVSSYIFHFINC